jgi:glucose-1-phosphate cytidylyltransferase
MSNPEPARAGAAPAVGDITVAILCGGRGTRLQEHTRLIPKPLVEVGGRPIVWHVIQIYAAQGFRRFALLTGYLHEQIDEYVAATEWPEGVEVEAIDTGEDTPTGGRVHAVAERLGGGGTFCLTYADGVADVDLGALVDFHHAQGAAATMTVVQPFSQWGIAVIEDDGHISGFREKPRLEHWINGGFFCFEPEALGYLEPDSTLEREPLEGLAADGKLAAYSHGGFWECMDTYKDMIELNDLWDSGTPPWRVWSEEHEASHR